MEVDERRNRLLELVRQRGFASLPELAEELGVSESTVRRDLDYLEENGSASGLTAACFTPAVRRSYPSLRSVSRRSGN